MGAECSLSFLGRKSWDKQFILIKPQAGPHAEMQLLKSFDERGRGEGRKEEQAARRLVDRAPAPRYPDAGTGSEREKQTGATDKKETLAPTFRLLKLRGHDCYASSFPDSPVR